jgi:hypothetical protein
MMIILFVVLGGVVGGVAGAFIFDFISSVRERSVEDPTKPQRE